MNSSNPDKFSMVLLNITFYIMQQPQYSGLKVLPYNYKFCRTIVSSAKQLLVVPYNSMKVLSSSNLYTAYVSSHQSGDLYGNIVSLLNGGQPLWGQPVIAKLVRVGDQSNAPKPVRMVLTQWIARVYWNKENSKRN